LIYADDNILGGSVHTKKKNSEALAVASREARLEIYADITNYSRNPCFWFANYPDPLGPASTFIDNYTKKIYLEITGYQITYSTVLWFLELQIRCGQNDETQIHTVNSNSQTSNCQCSQFSNKSPIIWIFCTSARLTIPINLDAGSSTVHGHVSRSECRTK
jgi:hypothetical protein